MALLFTTPLLLLLLHLITTTSAADTANNNSNNNNNCPITFSGCHCNSTDFNDDLFDFYCPEINHFRMRHHNGSNIFTITCTTEATEKDLLENTISFKGTSNKLDSLVLEYCPTLSSYTKLTSILGILELKELTIDGDTCSGTCTEQASLSEKQFSGLDHLTALSINSLHLKNIDSNMFQGLTKLETLKMYDNKLITLPRELFKPLYSLLNLHLYEPKLEQLPEDIFGNQGQLKMLDLGALQHSIPPLLFHNLTSLENLSLHDFKQEKGGIPAGLFDSCHSLKNIKVEGTGFQYAPTSLLANTGVVSFAWAEYNTNEPAEFGNQFVKGENCKLQRFQFLSNHDTNPVNRSLPEDFFQGCKDMKEVILSSAGLTSVPRGIFQGLASLEKIDLSTNAISAVIDATLKGLDQLKEINLEKNKIVSIPEGLFQDCCKALVKIVLNNNRLTALHDSTFKGLSALEELSIGNNNFHNITAQLFTDSVALKKLHLDANGLAFDDTDYRFGFNPIGDEAELTAFLSSSLPALELLDLNFLDFGPQLNVSKLKFPQANLELDISYNNISFVDLRGALKEEMRTNGNKLVLNLRGNPLDCGKDAWNLFRLMRGELNMTLPWLSVLTYYDGCCNWPTDLKSLKMEDLDGGRKLCDWHVCYPSCPQISSP